MRNPTSIIALILGIAAITGIVMVLLPNKEIQDDPGTAPSLEGAAEPEPDRKQAASPVPVVPNNAGVVRTDGILTDGPVPERLDIRSSLPPGTTVPVRDLPHIDHGIPMPNGSFLPLLNGMTQAPRIMRAPRDGDPGPIVAKTVDGSGYEWWVHADGSTTTSKYKQVVLEDGTSYWDPATFHNTPRGKESTIPLDPKAQKKGR